MDKHQLSTMFDFSPGLVFPAIDDLRGAKAAKAARVLARQSSGTLGTIGTLARSRSAGPTRYCPVQFTILPKRVQETETVGRLASDRPAAPKAAARRARLSRSWFAAAKSAE